MHDGQGHLPQLQYCVEASLPSNRYEGGIWEQIWGQETTCNGHTSQGNAELSQRMMRARVLAQVCRHISYARTFSLHKHKHLHTGWHSGTHGGEFRLVCTARVI